MSKKIVISKEELYELYIVQNKTQKEIAELFKSKYIGKLLKKYNIVKSKDQIQKSKEETNLKKFGCKNVMQNEDVKKKKEETDLKKYGHKCTLQNEDVKKKKEETNLIKFGYTHPMKNKDVQKKMEETNLEKFGCTHPAQRHIPKDKIEIYTNKDKLINWLNSINYEERTSIYCCKLLGITLALFDRYIIKYNIYNLINHTSSEWENGAKRWFDSNYPNLNVHYNTKSIIKPYELDIYIPEYNLAIELNGLHWHSDKMIQKNKHMSAEEYHNMKNELCKEQGITLYTIWDTDLNENNTLEQCLKNIFNTLQ